MLQLGSGLLVGTAGCGEWIGPDLPERRSPTTATPVPVPATEFSERRPRILVRNRSLSPQQVSITLDSDGVTTFSHQETVSPVDTVRYEQVVSSPGTYRVSVTSSFDRRVTSQWTVSRPTQALVVRFSRSGVLSLGSWIRSPTDGGEFVERTTTNDLSGMLAERTGDFPLPAVLVLQPAARGNYEPGVRIAAASRTVLDATYRVPSESPLGIPITTRSGRYDITVEVNDTESKYNWHVAEPTELHVTPRDSGPNVTAFVRPHPAFSPRDVVGIQLTALENNDRRRNDGIRTVWRFAAPRTKRRFERFENFADLFGRTGYAPLFRFEQFEFDSTERQNDQVFQRVRLTGDDVERTLYEFVLVPSSSLTADDSSAWTTATFFSVPE